jgi:hypothetical protein
LRGVKHQGNYALAEMATLAIGFKLAVAGEGAERTLNLPVRQNELVPEAAAAKLNTIVVVTSGGSVNPTPWLDRVPTLEN